MGAPSVRIWLCVLACTFMLGCGERDDDTASSESEPARGTGASNSESERKPNLVLITMDTTRADALGTYGQALPASPNIDRIAANGVVFEQAVTSSPETLPSHASIFTGLQPYVHGVRANAGFALSEENLTLAEVLAGHGYRTGAEIAAGVLGSETQIRQGFEHQRDSDSPDAQLFTVTFNRDTPDQQMIEKSVRLGSDITRRGLEFIQRHRDEPFFLWLHYFDSHSPYAPPAHFGAAIPDNPYHACVASVDHEVGRIVEKIENLRLREKTLVVITSDHGEGLGDHGELTHSFFVYDTTMRVPLIFWGLDGELESRRIDSLVRTIDIAPTVLDLLGLDPLPGAEGVSLRPQFGGYSFPPLTAYGESSWRFLGTFGISPLRFVREGKWKYIHKVNPELYDVVADPKEIVNRIDDEPAIAARLRKSLEEMIRSAPLTPRNSVIPVDSETAAQLAALGYASSTQLAEVDDEFAMLTLAGLDPVSRAPDIQRLSIVADRIRRKQYAKAVDDLASMAARNPDSAFILRLYTEALLGLDRNDEAIPMLRRMHELGAAKPNEIAKLAALISRKGDLAGAIELLEETLGEEPCHEGALSDFNLILRAEARYPELLEVLGKAAEGCPEVASNLNNYAWALATLPRDDLRDGAKAVAVARAALEAEGTRDVSTLDTLAAALAETGDFEQAARVQTEILEELKAAHAPEAVIAPFTEHLTAYQAGRPIRDP
ncbi:MAG: sulfatase-like hydrolase/transferase [Deltaproteobacteria bacterium]|nr:sulfatase-like hydrolase/transferase [Deltaproteobacteria bacterium]